MARMTDFGPTGQLVYERTYSRKKPDGSQETWPETVRRVVDGNLALVPESRHQDGEREKLIELMEDFKILPAGRHLWASGVGGRQYLYNCWTSGWTENITDHFEFTFLRLMEGGGVGANYSNHYLDGYPDVLNQLRVHIVCDSEHPDYEKMKQEGVLSSEYDAEWPGSYAVEDSREGWAEALTELLRTYYRHDVEHENRVFDVSRVRAEGARLKTFGGKASGPAPLGVMMHSVARTMNHVWEYMDSRMTGLDAMDIDHAIAQCVVSGGNRRSARMSIMHWADPQITEFLTIKEDTGEHWTTNISVEVDSWFWDLVNLNEPNDADYSIQRNDAYDVLDAISEGMLANGEPGIWDSSLSNRGEPNPVTCTNPCGEIVLEPWEPCCLGHVNLAAFAMDNETVNLIGLYEAHRLMTRFLIRATFGDVNDPKSAEVLARNRRIGVGHFGFASFVAMMGDRYSETHDSLWVQSLLKLLANEVDAAAREYAHQLRIPVPVKTKTVAPTGTIAKMPGVSEGIHPIFAKWFIRRIRLSTIDPEQFKTAMEYAAQGYNVEECQYAPNTLVVAIPTKDTLVEKVESRYGSERAAEIVESVEDLSLDDLLAVQAMYQEYWADNAVSFTANVDPASYEPNEIAHAIEDFGGLVKGFTVFPEMSRPQSPYERITEAEYERFGTSEVSDGIDEECASGACPVR